VSSRFRGYFSRTWWSLSLSGGFLAVTVALAAWWGIAGDDAPSNIEPWTVICGSAVALLELLQIGRKPEEEHFGPSPYVVMSRTFGRAVPFARADDPGVPAAKVLGAARQRRLAFRPASVVNIGGSALDALDGSPVEGLNRGAGAAGCLQVTGNAGLTDRHRRGGDLVFRIDPTYVSCRDENGRFDLQRLKDLALGAPLRALEIDLRQRRAIEDVGARARPVGRRPFRSVRVSPPPWQDRPARHAEFSDVDSLLDWSELLAAETGLPIGLRPTVGDMSFWHQLTELMSRGDRGVDFVVIDTGPVADAPRFHAALTLPFLTAVSRLYGIFARSGLHESVFFVGSGGTDDVYTSMAAFALGCDSVEIGARLLPALGEAGPVAPWTRRPGPKRMADDVALQVQGMRRNLLQIAEVAGVEHPGLLDADAVVEAVNGAPLSAVYDYGPGWGLPSYADRAAIVRLMSGVPEEGWPGLTPPTAAETGARPSGRGRR
jgi:hypothetical protein